jgi:DNA-binding response OmpR family regulator
MPTLPEKNTMKRILVIEDDPVGREMLNDCLTAWGYHVVWASNGDEGVELAKLVNPDLVLCDVLLPKKSGFQVCFELKRGNSRTPVLLMSAILQGGAEQRYAKEDLKADGYLVKPFQMSAMLARIQQLLAA